MRLSLDPLLTGIAGVVSAVVVAYFTTVFARRRDSAVERRNRTTQVEHDEAILLAQFLKSAATAIQNFRDTLQMVVRAPKGTISADSVVENIHMAGDAYIRLYREHVGAVPPELAALTHDVKNVILDCYDSVRDEPLEVSTLRYLQEVRQELRLVETKIAAARLEHLQRYTRAGQGGWL